MLATTLATTFVPGTNLKGDVVGANWSFLLPGRELERTVCTGLPPSATLATLASISREVIVVCASARQIQKVSTTGHEHGLKNLHPSVVNDRLGLQLPDDSADLVVITGGSRGWQFARDRAMVATVRRVLKPEGLIYFEFGWPVGWLLGARALDSFREEFAPIQLFWLSPLRGEMHTAVPLDDRQTISYFVDHGLASQSINLRPLQSAGRLLGRHRQMRQQPPGERLARAPETRRNPARQVLRSVTRIASTGLFSALERAERTLTRVQPFNRLTRRTGVLVGGVEIDGPPHYLRAIAREADINIDDHRWGLSAPSEFSSRKLLFFLFGPASESPEYIVKLTRDPVLNPRLENEYQALALLQARGVGDSETLPQPLFLGYHSNLAIVGETAIKGTPFRQRTQATADCPYAHAAIDWLIELGATTVDGIGATPKQVVETLRVLFDRFVQIYQLAPAHSDFLAEQITAIGRTPKAFPLVFQHGDPGTWNVLVTRSGRVAFLDWEAAEPQGMPLWDLFYFLRSYSIGTGRARGIRNRLEGFTQQFLAESPLSSLVVDSVARYLKRTGLPTELVEPLFYTCWMHRALKEATRLVATTLEYGHYVSLLRLCIDQRSSPTLCHLFSLQQSVELEQPSSRISAHVTVRE
ncbi:MAG TPA: hypothetical protein DEP84_21340 [Chloroflexi bacterium]|nr:hypothetical protein [Chloroflexota bacterium]